jgi:hypothetical protein
MPGADVVCERFANIDVPAADEPTIEQSAGLHGCDAEALYYGINQAPDYARARQCAFGAASNDDTQVIGGPELLMMIYANGQGVTANLDLALRFACQVGGAPAELGKRVARLWAARASRAGFSKPFDVCDDVTSGLMDGYCTAHAARIEAVPRAARKREATLGFPAKELSALDGAAQRFFDLRCQYETDQTGTMRAAIAISERSHLEDALVAKLEQLKDPAFAPPAADSAELEKRLKTLVSSWNTDQDLAQMERLFPAAVSRAGMHRTQASWLVYRQAFVALATKLRPGSKPDAWRAFLDQERLAQIDHTPD